MSNHHHRWQHRPYGVLSQPCDTCTALATWFETAAGVDGRTRVVSRACRPHHQMHLAVVR